MRILMVIPQVFYSARGTPLSAYHRIKDLMSLGHEVEVLTYKPGDPPPDLDIVIHRSFGPHFGQYPKQGPSYVKIWFDTLILFNLIFRLVRSRYDLIYGHEEGGFLGALVSLLFRVPVIYDMHSSLPLQIRDWDFSNSESVIRIFRWVERFTLKHACAVVSISPGISEAAKRAVPDAKVVTILNRFSLDVEGTLEEGRRIRKELGFSDEDKIVLYTGSFVALQSLNLLVKAIPFVVSRMPEARFVLVGGTETEIAELNSLAQEVGANSNITMLTQKPQSEMPAYMAACDVVVSPRIRGINAPGKLFSYLNSGKPLVATNCPIHTQLLDDSFSILAAPDPKSFADGIVVALGDKDRVRAITRSAKGVLATKYNPERRAEAYQQLFVFVESFQKENLPPDRVSATPQGFHQYRSGQASKSVPVGSGELRILFCNYEYPPLGGGGGVVNASLAEEMAKRHQVTVLTSQGLGLPPESVEQGVRVIRVPVFFRREEAVANLSSMAAFIPQGISVGRKLLQNHRYDVINTHFVLPTGPVGDAISRYERIPNVLSVHGGDLYDPSKWASPHRHPLLRAWIRRLLRRSDMVVGQSSDTLQNMRRFYTPEIEGMQIPLGIRKPVFDAASRADYGFNEDEILLVTVGRLIARKAIHELIMMMDKLRENKIRLLILGTGPQEHSLREESAKRHLEDQIVFVGQVGESEKFRILAVSDLYVSTSQHEGFGLVYLEAMACGLPIVCYDRGGQRDFLRDQETGFLVSLNDLDSFKSRCELLIRNPSLRRVMGEKNRRRAEEFWIERCALSYERVFSEVIEMKAREKQNPFVLTHAM